MTAEMPAEMPAERASLSTIPAGLFVNINKGMCGMSTFNSRAAAQTWNCERFKICVALIPRRDPCETAVIVEIMQLFWS